MLDDGWFGRRDSDDRSLGDWVVDRRKLPHGLDGIARAVTDLGLAFGIWIEPEMVNPDSDLYRAHPDWVVGIEGRQRTESRQQLVLDFGRPEVVDHLADALGAILASAPITYVKWDMNRYLTEVGSGALPPGRQGETSHRHTLGVYELYRRLIARVPGRAVRVVRQRRRPLRPGDACLRAAGLDQRRHRRHRAPRRSSGGRRWSTR